MLMPRKVKHRKQQRGRMSGKAKGGSDVTFGDFGIQALEPAWLTARQIEAARIAMTRHVKRGGKVWIRVFPDRPVTQKPAETRMGSGKGNPEHWVAVVKPGRILFELAGVEPELAREAMDRAIQKLPVQGPVRDPARDPRHAGGAGLMATAAEIAEYDTEELERQLGETRRELFNLRFQLATGQLDNFSRDQPRAQGRGPDDDRAAEPGDRRGRGHGHRRASRPRGRGPPPLGGRGPRPEPGPPPRSAGPRPGPPRKRRPTRTTTGRRSTRTSWPKKWPTTTAWPCRRADDDAGDEADDEPVDEADDAAEDEADPEEKS